MYIWCIFGHIYNYWQRKKDYLRASRIGSLCESLSVHIHKQEQINYLNSLCIYYQTYTIHTLYRFKLWSHIFFKSVRIDVRVRVICDITQMKEILTKLVSSNLFWSALSITYICNISINSLKIQGLNL